MYLHPYSYLEKEVSTNIEQKLVIEQLETALYRSIPLTISILKEEMAAHLHGTCVEVDHESNRVVFNQDPTFFFIPFEQITDVAFT
ncbi:hypothetical protein [Geomicrobium sp. JCM 19038]|uniref:hypothetical protein n=1 Tax=Geomicrobium sp. JCM 19038 TaxID=1460635 RepID=UPI00045F250C|nr:hypothetical protein [Geomicrobium sp. JCM 19038]GAK09944.1 hypothetical protein JCM19038_3819 [Geomicrobium sp. JCM 19038]